MAKAKVEIKIDAKGTPALKGQTKAIKEQTKALRNQGKTTKTTEKRARSFHQRQEKGVIGVANQTKSFSKMAQTMDGGGAGGLVRAYALLAANVFALSMAFGVLSRSAQIDTLTKAMEKLEVVSGKAIRGLARDLQEASGYGMDFADSMRATSLALSAGFQTETIQELAEVARNASVSLGRNMADGLDRIFRGVIKVEPELLDEIGLFVRVREAAARYAADIGVAAADLTEFQRRQAFANEALRQGKEKFQDFADIPTDVYSQLSAKVSDLAQKVLSMLNNVLGPMIDLLSKSQASLGFLFGLVAIALLKKALPAMGLMTKGAAEQAADARKNHINYIKSVDTRGSKDRAKALEDHQIALKAIEDNIKVNKSKDAAVKKSFGITGGGKLGGQKARKAEEKFNKARKAGLTQENKLIMKQAALEKQGALATSKKRATKKETIAAIEKEQRANEEIIRSLERQLGLHKDILIVEEEEVRLGVQKGSFAEKTEARLGRKEITSQSLATVAATAETQGMGQAFKQMRVEAKDMKLELKETGKGVGVFGRQAFKLKGTFGILTTGINKMMMALGPWIMAFTMLLPIIMKVLKAMGFMSEEAEKLSKAKNRLEEQTKILSKVTAHQTEVMNDGKSTALQYLDAHLAFGHAILATLKAIKDLEEADKKFIKSASKSVKVWNTIVERWKLGFDMLLQLKDIIQMDVEFDIRDSGERAFEATIDEMLADRGNMSIPMTALTVGTDVVKETDIEIAAAERKLKLLKAQMTIQKANQALVGRTQEGRDEILRIQGLINKEEGKTLMARRRRAAVLFRETEQGQTILDQKAKEVDAEENLKSIREGARDALREFRDQFIEKTTVDKPLTVMNQLVEGLNANNKKLYVGDKVRLETLNHMAHTRDDMFQMLSKERKIAFLLTMDEEKRVGIIREQARAYADIQRVLKRNAVIIKDIQMRQGLIKNLVKTTVVGVKEHFKLNKQTRDAAIELEEVTLRMRMASEGILEDDKESLFTQGRIAEIMDKLRVSGLARGQAEDFIRELMKLETKELQNQWKTTVEVFEEADKLTKLYEARLKLQTKGVNLLFKEWQLTQKLNAFAQTGSTELTGSQKLEAVIKEEEVRLKAVNLMADIEKKLIKSKYDRLRDEQKLLGQMHNLEDRKMMHLNKSMWWEMFKIGKTRTLTAEEIKIKEDSWKRTWALRDKLALEGTDKDPYVFDTSTLDWQETMELGNIDKELNNLLLEFDVKLRETLSDSIKYSFSTDIISIKDTNIFKLLDQMKSIDIFKDQLGKAETGINTLLEKTKAEQDAVDTKLDPASETYDEDLALYIELEEKILRLEAALNRISTENMRTEFSMASSVLMDFADQVREMGPAGFLGATIAEFGVSVGDAFLGMKDRITDIAEDKKLDATQKKLGTTIEKLKMASHAMAGIQQIMAAASANKVAGIDNEIAAEKKRDGKSKESLGKIKQLEAKKDKIQRKAFETNKKVQMAQTIINTAATAMKMFLEYGPWGAAAAIVMGAAQLAIIASTSYQSSTSDVASAPPGSIEVGKRTNKVDVSKKASAGELAYLRGEQGIGTTSTNFIAQGGAAGLRKGYAGGKRGIQRSLVGERGPEMLETTAPFNVVPSYAMGGGAPGGVVSFTINAIDAVGVEEVLMEQKGNIISMIRTAANDYGEEFLEAVNTDTYGGEGPTYGFEEEIIGGSG